MNTYKFQVTMLDKNNKELAKEQLEVRTFNTKQEAFLTASARMMAQHPGQMESLNNLITAITQ